MATKLRNLATSIITKTVLFSVILGCIVVFLCGTVIIVNDTNANKNLQIESIGEMYFQNSHYFLNYESNFVGMVMKRGDVSQISNYDKMPAFYFHAKYDDGSTYGNCDWSDEEFTRRKFYNHIVAYSDGSWQMDGLTGGNSWQISNTMSYVMDRYANSTNLDVYELIDGDLYTQYLDDSDTQPERYVIADLYYAVEDADMASYQEYWQNCRYYFLSLLLPLMGMLLLGALSYLWLLICCGRRPGDNELHLLALDKLPTELNLLIVFCGGSFTIIMAHQLCFDWVAYRGMADDPIMLGIAINVITVLAALTIIFSLSTVRLLKAKRFIKNSLTYRIIRWCWRPFGKLFSKIHALISSWDFHDTPLTLALHKRQLAFLTVLGITMLAALVMAIGSGCPEAVSLIVFVAIIAAPAAYILLRRNRTTFEEINKGFSETVAKQVKSENTKTELITNVSHDLKTPLTSIITYLELLQKEELSDAARDYVTIISQKADRLKAMVSDLFDLAKSSSGNIPLNLETLDLRRLLEQTMADMRDSIDASGLVFKVSLPEQSVFICSDGKKLYRVFQNVIGNTLKYSLDGTRVYISLQCIDNRAVAIVRNTAGYEMTFTSEEVLQRFVRGDSSRTGDGSGLGLSIAESFSTACGGSFKVDVDGDLFKVTVSFPLVEAPQDDSKNA